MKSVVRNKRSDPTRAASGPDDEGLDHRPQLARRSRQEDDEPAADVDHLTGRGSIRVLENDTPLNHQGLPPVHVGHLQTPACKPLHEAVNDLGVLDERKAEHVCQRIPGHVIVGRPEAAGQDDEIDAIQRTPEVLGNLPAVVADHGLRP